MNLEPVTFISAELSSLDYYENQERMSQLRLDLLNAGFSMMSVRMNGTSAYLVSGKNQKSLKKLAQKYEQANFYQCDKNRKTFKISCLEENTKYMLGKLLKNDKLCKMYGEKDLTITFQEDGTNYVYQTEL